MQDNTMLSVQGEREVWGLMKEQSDVFFKSQCIPASFKNMAQVLVAIQMGRELGFSASSSVNNIYPVNGKLSMQADMIGALLKKGGYKFRPIENTNKVCRIEFTSPDGEKIEFKYTWEDAITAKLTGKDNWVKYPKSMLYKRALSNGGRMIAPEVLMGIYSIEEMQDTEIPLNLSATDTQPVETTKIDVEVVEEKEVTPEVIEVEEVQVEEIKKEVEETLKEIDTDKTIQDVEKESISERLMRGWTEQVEGNKDNKRVLTSFRTKLSKLQPTNILSQEQINNLVGLVENKLSLLN